MISFSQKVRRNPLWLIAVLWPFVLLVPYLPGLYRPVNGGLPWRQELIVALLLSVTLAFLIKRTGRRDSPSTIIPRRELLFFLVPAALFVAWNAVSMFWSNAPHKTAYMALTWSMYLIFFVLMRSVTACPRMLRASLFSLAAVICTLGAACTLWFIGKPPGAPAVAEGALFGFFSGFSEMMAVVTPLFAALALYVRKPRLAFGCGVTALLAWLSTLQAMERAPTIGAAVGLLLLFAGSLVLRNCRPRHRARVLFLITVFVAMTALQLTITRRTDAEGQGKHTAIARLQTTDANDANFHVRFLYWNIAFEMMRPHPLIGAGGYTYDVNFSDARSRFAATHPNNPLIGMNEEMLIQQPHSEYVQVLTEFGIVGFTLFTAFCLGLISMFWCAMRESSQALPALGAGGGLLAFALASGTSVNSFQWMGGGLVFFFAAAIVCRTAARNYVEEAKQIAFAPARLRLAISIAFVLAFTMVCGSGIRAMNAVLQGTAARTIDSAQAEKLYEAAISWDRRDAGTHLTYGNWLYGQKRAREAVPHLRYGVANGFNTSDCFVSLAAAEAEAGDLQAAEATLRYAVKVYPRSVFLRVRHASAMLETGATNEAGDEYAAALSLDKSAARGWWQLIRNGADAAKLAADADSGIAPPGGLFPNAGIFVVIAEHERRSLASAPSEDELLCRLSH